MIRRNPPERQPFTTPHPDRAFRLETVDGVHHSFRPAMDQPDEQEVQGLLISEHPQAGQHNQEIVLPRTRIMVTKEFIISHKTEAAVVATSLGVIAIGSLLVRHLGNRK